MKTTFLTMTNQLHRSMASLVRRCVLAGAREVEELRARTGPRCPHCDGQLMLRRVGFGRDAGRQFWDCTNVPRCCVSIAAEEMIWPGVSAPGAITAAAA
jgi:hypothetical protein